MTYPRAHLIDAENGGFYHLHARCVRRTWLCGHDELTGRSFEHRKEWLEQRILKLASLFCVSLVGYAVMSNHYHVVVEARPQDTAHLSDEEVAERWDQISFSNCVRRRALNRAHMFADAKRMATCRRRLGDLSQFMAYINEPLARMMNREDGCTGRAWEGRFKSSALLDDAAVLRCLVYVDLNPVRAGLTERAAKAPCTSIRRRCAKPDAAPLTPLSALGLTLRDYVALAEWTASHYRRAQFTEFDPGPPPEAIRQTHTVWCSEVDSHRHRYRAYGTQERLRNYVSAVGQSWIKTHPDAPARHKHSVH